MWTYQVSGLNKTEIFIKNLDSIGFTLLTNKGSSYLLWKQLRHSFSKKEHLDPILRQNLKSLSLTVNKISG
jgi:hypothetical protein